MGNKKIFYIIMFCVCCSIYCFNPYGQIRGVVVEVNHITKGSSFNSFDIKKTIVEFKDGRKKIFEGISNATFYKGEINIITYDKFSDTIVSVQKIN